MKITFINHSGFFIEQENTCILFDYWKGQLPEPMDKALFVFSSHAHGDHFNPEILEYGKRWKNVHWILAKDISKEKVPEEILDDVTFAGIHKAFEVNAGERSIHIETLQSTDQGVAYLVESEGKTLYHAGDLHLWIWRENEKNDKWMVGTFKKEMETLKGKTIDAAFLPLDPRQYEEDQFKGLDYTARIADIRHIYPMHCWQGFEIIEKLIADPCSESYRDRICNIRKDGQEDEI